MSESDEIAHVYGELKEHKKEMVKHLKRMEKCQEENASMIADLSENTKELIEIYRDAKGAIRIGGIIGRFLQWAASITAISVLVKWISSYFQG